MPLQRYAAPALGTTTLPVYVAGATAPSANQVLTAQSASVATWASVGGAAAGGMTLVASQVTESSTLSTTDVNLAALGVNIPALTPFKILFNTRKTAGFADRFHIGLQINATTVLPTATLNFTSASNQAEDGQVSMEVSGRVANFTHPGVLRATAILNAAGGQINTDSEIPATGVAFPTTAISSIIILGKVGNAAITGAISNLYVWTYPTS